MKKIYLIFPILMLVLTGCIKINTGTGGVSGAKTANLGGIYRSGDKGEIWKNISALATTGGKAADFAGLNIASMAIDPSDDKAVYFGSMDNGLLYTYDGGLSWEVAKSLGAGTIESISIDPKDKCTIYVTRKNKIMKSKDCNRSWEQVYQDNDQLAIMSNVTVDPVDSNIVYATIARGDLIKSMNAGNSWQNVNKFNTRIAKIIVNEKNNHEIFVVTYQQGIYKTTDSGANWTRMVEVDTALSDNGIKDGLRDFLVIDTEKGRSFFVASFYGLLKSSDNGVTWSNLELIAPKEKATINAMAVNPQNPDEIYYATNSTFYKSVDGGKSWKTIALPTARAGWKLLVNPVDPKIIFMGVVEMKK